MSSYSQVFKKNTKFPNFSISPLISSLFPLEKTYQDMFLSLKDSFQRSLHNGKLERNSRIFWDMLIFLVIFFEIWYIPLFVSFDRDLSQNSRNFSATPLIELFQHVAISLISLDIFFNFFVGYYKKGLFITNQARILVHYLSLQFWTDSLSLFFLILSNAFDNSPYYALIFMINLIKLNKIRKKMIFFFNNRGKRAFLARISSLSFTIIFLSHLFSCTWYIVAMLEVSNNPLAETWVQKSGLLYEDWQIKYVFAFYYSIVTIVTVGYGDVTPSNTDERICSCFFILIGCITFGYCINCIGLIFSEISEELNSFEEKIREIDQYMRKRDVDLDLQIRVRNYIEWIEKEEGGAREKEDRILKPLSRELKEEVLYQVYGERIRKIELLKKNFSRDLLKGVALKVRDVSFVPEENIFKVRIFCATIISCENHFFKIFVFCVVFKKFFKKIYFDFFHEFFDFFSIFISKIKRKTRGFISFAKDRSRFMWI